MSFNLLTAKVLSYPRSFKLFAIIVALVVSGPRPIATIFIPKLLNVFTIARTASGSDGSPSLRVKKISGLYLRLLDLCHSKHFQLFFEQMNRRTWRLFAATLF